MRTLKAFAVYLSLSLLYFAGCIAMGYITIPLVNHRTEAGAYKTATNGNVDFTFPVLVVTCTEDNKMSAVIVDRKSIKELKSEHPKCSFLVPRNMQATFGKQVAAENQTEELAEHGKFEVKQLPNGNQHFKVVAYRPIDGEKSYIFVSWYEASKNGIKPEYFSSNRAGDTYVFYMLPWLFVYTVIFFVTVGLIHWRLKKRSRKRQNAA